MAHHVTDQANMSRKLTSANHTLKIQVWGLRLRTGRIAFQFPGTAQTLPLTLSLFQSVLITEILPTCRAFPTQHTHGEPGIFQSGPPQS